MIIPSVNKITNGYLSEIRNRDMQPSELQVKLNTLKKNIWTGLQSDEKGPLSWGVSSFATNSYFTDSESLLRSCSKKLEMLECDFKQSKVEKKKRKAKLKKISMKVPSSDDVLESKPVTKLNKKKGKLKYAKSECLNQTNNVSFCDIPRNSQPMLQGIGDRKSIKSFRKSAYVASAIQTKKTNKSSVSPNSDNLDSDDSAQIRKNNTKKRTKTMKNKIQKSTKQ